jgi:thiosulfate/3-mercaptopyruvate sulfurtransferase
MKLEKSGAITALIIVVMIAAIFFIFENQLIPNCVSMWESSDPILVPFSEAKGYDVILDISPTATAYIKGAINVNYEVLFDQDKRLKPAASLSQILGNAGISRNDSVLVYGKCQPCGGGPSAATYAFWVLKYLGQKKIGLLDGEIENWTAAALPTSQTPTVRPKTSYLPKLNAEMMTTYDQVNNSRAKIVDARTPQDYTSDAIPGSVNIPYDAVLENGRLKNQTALSHLFVGLDKNRSVVVYTATGVKASMVCFALELTGYKACLYTWNDWIAHRGSEGIRGNNRTQVRTSLPGSQNISK